MKFSGRFGPPRAPGWPETDSPRKMIASSGVETRIRALGTRFVAIFRFREICDVDYNLSSEILTLRASRRGLTEDSRHRVLHQVLPNRLLSTPLAEFPTPQTHLGQPQNHPTTSKSHFKTPKTTPRRPQNHSKTPETTPRPPKSPPKRSQDHPNTPKSLPQTPKTTPKPPRPPPGHLKKPPWPLQKPAKTAPCRALLFFSWTGRGFFGTERGGPFKKKKQRLRKSGRVAKNGTAPRREAHFQEGRPAQEKKRNA